MISRRSFIKVLGAIGLTASSTAAVALQNSIVPDTNVTVVPGPLRSQKEILTFIQDEISKVMRSQMFEVNDEINRLIVKSNLDLMLEPIKKSQEISDYFVLCDETNNTPSVIAKNQLICVVTIQTSYSKTNWEYVATAPGGIH